MPKKPPRNNLRNRTPRTVQSAAPILRRIIQHHGVDISSDNQLVESLRAKLPQALRSHVIQVMGKGAELVVLADSAAWAARLKLALAEDPGLAGGRSVTVKVAPRGAAGR